MMDTPEDDLLEALKRIRKLNNEYQKGYNNGYDTCKSIMKQEIKDLKSEVKKLKYIIKFFKKDKKRKRPPKPEWWPF